MLTQASELLTRPPLARFSKRIQVAFISHTGHSVSWATAPPTIAITALNCTAVVTFTSAVQRLPLLWPQVHSTLWQHPQLAPVTPWLQILPSSWDKERFSEWGLLVMLQLQLALLLSVKPQLLLLLPSPKMVNPQELSATRIISAALSPIAPVSLIAGVLRLTLQVPRLTPSESQVAATLLILRFKLQPRSPPPLRLHSSLSTWVSPRLPVSDSPPYPNEAAASQVLQAPSFSLAACQCVSRTLLQWFCRSVSVSTSPPPPLSLSLPSFIFPLLPLTVSPSARCVSRRSVHVLYGCYLCWLTACYHVALFTC